MTNQDPTVSTEAGILRGSVEKNACVFKGIPYGAPTDGANRFRPPRPAVPWIGVRDATRFGPSCPQMQMGGGHWDPKRAVFPGLADPTYLHEDCLSLNLWTPAVGDGGKRPVMVWLHGGGLTSGCASSPLYDGAALSTWGDVVVVTLNHRLGILGYLHLAPFMNDDFRSAGMVGMLDIVAALQWVQANVEAFGGDPKRVTLFGQSGGGQKVGNVLVMPAAQGLFHRAIIQSGNRLFLGTRMDQAELARYVLDRLGIEPGDGSALGEAPLSDLIEAAVEVGERFGLTVFSGVVDGVAMPAQPGDLLAEGVAAEVPLLVGSTTREFQAWAPTGQVGEHELVAMLGNVLGRKDTGSGAQEPLAVYRRSRPGASNTQLFADIFTDYVRMIAVRTAEAKLLASRSAVYTYLFAGHPALHCGELPYLFRWGRNDTVADQIAASWVAFARTGDPNSEYLPVWPAHTLDRRETMVFDRDAAVKSDPLRETRQLWDVIPASF